MSIFAKWEEEYLSDNIELSDIKMAWLYSDIILTQTTKLGIMGDIKMTKIGIFGIRWSKSKVEMAKVGKSDIKITYVGLI